MRRGREWRALRRGRLRWWLVYGPVRSGTTLMTNLIAPHCRWVVSDWGLRHVLGGPLSNPPATYDSRSWERSFLAEVLASCRTGHGGPLDMVFKQANLRLPEYESLVTLLGPPERSIFCLRDPAGFMRSARQKFPDHSLEHLQEFNYLGTGEEHAHIGGEVFLYHPDVTGDDYAAFLQPLSVSVAERDQVRYTGSGAPELTTDEMWQMYERLLAVAVNAPINAETR